MDLKYAPKFRLDSFGNIIENPTMYISKERVIDSLYTHCQIRTNSTVQVLDAMVKDLNISLTISEREKLIEIIRPYKLSSKNLEVTATAIYDLVTNKSWGGGSGFTLGFQHPPVSFNPEVVVRQSLEMEWKNYAPQIFGNCNDDLTRSQCAVYFTAQMEAWLRKGEILEYRIVCDYSNNTAKVIDDNQFICDVFVRFAKTINFTCFRLEIKQMGAYLTVSP